MLTPRAGIRCDLTVTREDGELFRVVTGGPSGQHDLAWLRAQVRDGQRALTIVERLAQTVKTTEVGETLSMALAELGRFDEAVMVQREVRDAVMQGGDRAALERVTQNLALYTRKQPCRRPWRDDEPLESAAPG